MWYNIDILMEDFNLKVMGLDISSSTIGYSICESGKLTSQGHYKPMKSKSKGKNNHLAERLSKTYNDMKKIIKDNNPDVVVIEDYAKRFSAGRSSARTIIVLSCFNEVVAMACLESIKKMPIRYAVSSIRKTLSLKGKTEKEDVLEKILEEYPDFKISKNRNDNIKKEVFDEADSLAVIIHHISEV